MSAALKEAVELVRAAFGAPGDYGYGTPKGAALYALYRADVPTDPPPALEPDRVVTMHCFVAYLDPTEGPRGYGETEDEAKADLLRQIEQREARS